MSNLQELYNVKKTHYHRYFENITSKISGRVCHPGILCLNILFENNDNLKNYGEIGVHNGGSMSIVVSSGSSKKTCYGIDLFEDMYDKTKHLNHAKYTTYQYFRRDNLNKTKSYTNIMNCNTTDSIVNLIQGNTYFDQTEYILKDYLSDTQLDVLFIDGDHTKDGVKNDYERYSKYVRAGGWIIFDDYHHSQVKSAVDSYHFTKFQLFQVDNTKAIQYIVQKI